MLLLASALFVVIFLFTTGFFYLKSNPVIIPCNGCDTGGWWYKCLEGTGQGSLECTLLTKTEKEINKLSEKVKDIKQKLEKVPENIRQVTNELIKTFNDIKDKLTVEINIPDIPKISFPNISCNIKSGNQLDKICKMPGVNNACRNGRLFELDPCSKITDDMNKFLDNMHNELGKAKNGIAIAIKETDNFIQNKLIKQMKDKLDIATNEILKPWNSIKKQIDIILDKATNIIVSVTTSIVSFVKNTGLVLISKVKPKWMSNVTFLVLSVGAIGIPVIGGLIGLVFALITFATKSLSK